MSAKPEKRFPTLGACGLDCGLCPRFHTDGSSRCPGCAGPGFFDRHPSCGIITCCVKNHGYEVCVECGEWPCDKFDPKIEDGGEYDSFITYQNVAKNMEHIRSEGLKIFIKEQKKRIKLLEKMLAGFDDGRSKTFYCLAATLLPVEEIESAVKIIEKKGFQDDKLRSKNLRQSLLNISNKERIELKLRKK